MALLYLEPCFPHEGGPGDAGAPVPEPRPHTYKKKPKRKLSCRFLRHLFFLVLVGLGKTGRIQQSAKRSVV